MNEVEGVVEGLEGLEEVEGLAGDMNEPENHSLVLFLGTNQSHPHTTGNHSLPGTNHSPR